MTLVSAAILLFLVIDPLGNLPLFLAALRPVDVERQRRVILRELLIAYGVMLTFLFAGHALLDVLRITEPALTIAGGVVLFLIALRMIFPPPGRSFEDEGAVEPFVVPLAIPYVAGPSVLATELLLMSREPALWPRWLAALTLAWTASAVILLSAAKIRNWLSTRGMIAIERLMGMLLVTIAIQMFLSGVETYIEHLRQAASGREAAAKDARDDAF